METAGGNRLNTQNDICFNKLDTFSRGILQGKKSQMKNKLSRPLNER